MQDLHAVEDNHILSVVICSEGEHPIIELVCSPFYAKQYMNNKKPVALLLNDIHISKDNIPEFQKNWDEAIRICKGHDVADMIVGGDLWLSRSAQTLDVLMAVRQAIIKATSQNITLTIAEGNHCKVDQESVLGYSHIFSEYPNVYVVDDYSAIEFGDNTVLYVMSYFPENGSFTERLQNLLATDFDSTKHNVLYIHEGIRGGLATPTDDELPASLFDKFDATLVGHYHNRKTIKDTHIEYIGSSRQHNFGEDEEKGYTLLYDDGSYEFVKNQANTRYKVIDLDLKNIDHAPAFDKDADVPYKLKACVRCASNEATAIDKNKLIGLGYTKVEIQSEKTEAKAIANQALDQKYDKSGIKEEYANFCVDKGISVEMGLQYLDKIN